MPAARGQDPKVWQTVFQELIHEVKPWHRWTLTADESLAPNTLQPGWTQYQQWGFARFSCSCCSRSWASAHVQILFHMHWSKRDSKGQVKMRIFAQRCQKCVQPPFEVPEFTEENISRILNNLVLRVLKKCYREGFRSMEEIATIKDVSLEGPHDSHNCEACLQGFCAQSGLDLAKPPPTSPTLPTMSVYEPSPARISTTVVAVTGDTRVKKEKVSSSPSVPEPPQAKSPRENPSSLAERVSSNPSVPEPRQAKSPRANPSSRVERVSSNPSVPEPPQAKSPRANPSSRVERVSSNPSVPEPPQAKSPRATPSSLAERVSSNLWSPEPPQAKSPRANPSSLAERVSSNLWSPEPPQAKSPRANPSSLAERVSSNLWSPEPPQAKSPRATPSSLAERVSSNLWSPEPPQAESPRANPSSLAERVSSNLWFPEPPQAKSPSATPSPGGESIIQVSFPREDFFPHTAQHSTHCHLNTCCCRLIILLLITVVVVIVFKITG